MRENIHEFATTGGVLLEAVPVETWSARASEKFTRRAMKGHLHEPKEFAGDRVSVI